MLRTLAIAAAFAAALPALPSRALDLLMVEQPGCVYCARWEAEIGPIWPRTEVAQAVPLRHVQKADGAPEGMRFARPVVFTPTFILVSDQGEELARLEGYPGENFFWPVIEKMVADHAPPAPAPETAPRPAPALD